MLLAAALALPLPAAPAGAVELSLGYPAIERVIWARLLTQGGRYFLEGRSTDDCRYAFVQEPKVLAQGSRLAVRFVFSGRAGARVAGRCLGPGDTLDVTASGLPRYEDGLIRLADLRLDAPGSAYFKLMAPLLQSRLQERLSYPLRAELEQALGAAAVAAGSPLRPRLVSLAVPGIAVEAQRLRVSVDLSLAVE